MRRALFGIVLTGLFVLLLSSLVVAPEPESADVSSPLPQDFHAVLMPAALPSAQADLTTPQSVDEMQMLSEAPRQTAADGLCRPASSDSNGRVIRAVRYENSFYQLFRPEVAGG